jgi:hypothetical protein
MAYDKSKALSHHWNSIHGYKTLEMVLKLLGYNIRGNGIEHGYFKETHGYWFCDDGDIEYSDTGYDS